MARTGLSIGSYIAAVGGVLLILTEIFAVEGILLGAIFDFGSMSTTGRIILSAFVLLPLVWLGIRLVRHAIRVEKDLQTDQNETPL